MPPVRREFVQQITVSTEGRGTVYPAEKSNQFKPFRDTRLTPGPVTDGAGGTGGDEAPTSRSQARLRAAGSHRGRFFGESPDNRAGPGPGLLPLRAAPTRHPPVPGQPWGGVGSVDAGSGAAFVPGTRPARTPR